jgi:predicted HicB family RNase H-like nuclease
MTRQSHFKQERIIEAVRQGCEGDATIEFMHQSGYAMTAAGISRHLKKLGGRGRVASMVEEGRSNVEILEACLPDEDLSEVRRLLPEEGDLFGASAAVVRVENAPLYSTTKLTIQIPSELYEAVRAAAQAERKSLNRLIVDLLSESLSRLPEPSQQQEFDAN